MLQLTAAAESIEKPIAVDLAAAQRALLRQTQAMPWLIGNTPRPLQSLNLAQLLPDLQLGPCLSGPCFFGLFLEANSEQRQPLHLGASLREQIIYGKTLPSLRLADSLFPLLRWQAQTLLKTLQQRKEIPADSFSVLLELWPTINDVGRLTWVISRYRLHESAPWQWLDAARHQSRDFDAANFARPPPILPVHLQPARRADFAAIFTDFLSETNKSLYEKPRFSECVWTNADKTAALAAWLPSAERPAQEAHFAQASALQQQAVWCIALPQPARFNRQAQTLHLRIAQSELPKRTVQFQLQESYTVVPRSPPQALPAALKQAALAAKLPSFPATFANDYRRDIDMLSGLLPLDVPPGAPDGPKSGAAQTLRLVRKNSADPQHQLDVLLDYLEARYKQLGSGILTQRQRFVWRGIAQSNLIAILPGRRAPSETASRLPIVLADHIDTAFCEKTFARKGQRVSVAGADDNVSAAAALLRAAAVLRALPPAFRKRDIWFVHLTGEEFPADDLGARRYIEELLRRRSDIGVLLLLDMIGVSAAQNREFQLNPAAFFDAADSAMQVAELAAFLTPQVSKWLKPRIYPPEHLYSYLYNTDGQVFAEAGFAVVHISEKMNRYDTDRVGYHDFADTPNRLNIGYAADIVRVTIATAAVLSQIELLDIP